jgi:hypothetical protein
MFVIAIRPSLHLRPNYLASLNGYTCIGELIAVQNAFNCNILGTALYLTTSTINRFHFGELYQQTTLS